MELHRDPHQAGNLFTNLMQADRQSVQANMVSKKVLRLWVRIACRFDISMLVSQPSAPIQSKTAMDDFFAWLKKSGVGIDLFEERAYQIPTAHIHPAACTVAV